MSAFLLPLLCCCCAAADPAVLWKYETPAPPQPPTPCAAGIAVAAGDCVALVSPAGAELWRHTTAAPAAGPVTVADLDADGAPEHIVPLQDGTVVCLNADGTQRWTRPFGARAGTYCAVTAADVHPAAGLELVTGFDDGWLYCLRADGRVLWRFFGDHFRVGVPAAGDATGDGFADIVYGTDNGNVYCLDGLGRVRWRFSDGAPYGRSGVNLADLDGDGRAEALLTRSNTGDDRGLAALDGATGALLWRTADNMQGYVSNAVVDLDGDGKREVLHGDKANFLYCENAGGTRRWSAELGGRGVFWAPAVADFLESPGPEIIVPVRDTDPATGACVHILNSAGALLHSLKPGAGANVSPAVTDLDGDGRADLIVATHGPNAVHAFKGTGTVQTLWPCARGGADMAARANVPAGRPADTARKERLKGIRADWGTCFVGTNRVQAAWNVPAPDNAFLETRVLPVRGGAPAEIRIVPVPAGAKEAAASLSFFHEGRFQAELRLCGPGIPPQTGCAKTVRVRPAEECGLDGVKRACARAKEAGAAAGADTGGLDTALAVLSVRRDETAAAARAGGDTLPSPLPALANALRQRAEDTGHLAALSERLWRAGDTGGFVCWPDDNPWNAFDRGELPAPEALGVPLHFTLLGGEQESAAVNLRNLGTAAVSVRCSWTRPDARRITVQPDPEGAGRVTLRRGVLVPSEFSGMVMDALPELDSTRTLTLPPGETAQLWLTADARGLAPGTHALTLFLGSVEGRMTLREIPVTLEVLPAGLPGGGYAQMNWVGVDVRDTPAAQLKDMLDHGITVAYGPRVPSFPVDAAGRPGGPVEWEAFDESLARLPEGFHLLFPGVPAPQWPEGAAPPAESPAAETAFAEGVRLLAAHLEERGWPRDRWAFYPFDEPWLTGQTIIPALRRFCERVRGADPSVRLYTDPTGMLKPEYLEPFKDLIDIWQPEINILKRNADLRAWFQKNAKTLWTYEATDPGKDLLPLGYYRTLGWLAWRLGVSGAGFWVYKGEDLLVPAETQHWSVVYASPAGVVPSRRWEAVRDGQEDYRLLRALRDAADRAEAAGRADAARRARALMDEAVERVAGWQVGVIDEITRRTRDYETDYAVLQDFRLRLMRELVSLSSAG